MTSIATSAGFYTARQQLGLSVSQCAKLCKVEDRTVRRWEDGTRDPAPSACRLLELALDRRIDATTMRELIA